MNNWFQRIGPLKSSWNEPLDLIFWKFTDCSIAYCFSHVAAMETWTRTANFKSVNSALRSLVCTSFKLDSYTSSLFYTMWTMTFKWPWSGEGLNFMENPLNYIRKNAISWLWWISATTLTRRSPSASCEVLQFTRTLPWGLGLLCGVTLLCMFLKNLSQW